MMSIHFTLLHYIHRIFIHMESRNIFLVSLIQQMSIRFL